MHKAIDPVTLRLQCAGFYDLDVDLLVRCERQIKKVTTTEIDQEAAVARFLALAGSWQARRLKAPEIMREMIGFYRDVRISSADPDAENDTLHFQWGVSQNLLFSEPTDLRPIEDRLEFDDVVSRFLEFSRLVFAPGDDGEAELDDLAIHMSVILLYGPATGEEQDGELRMSLKQIDHAVQEFLSQPFMSQLLHADPVRYVSLVGFCG